jgi:outer membrane receptor for Fe3+-dicitrate
VGISDRCRISTKFSPSRSATSPTIWTVYKTASTTYPNIFDIVERISAGYIMDTMDFGRLHVVAGVRFEGAQMDTLGYYVTLYPAGSSKC